MNIDLHCHSNVSDGALAPWQVLPAQVTTPRC